MRTSRTENKNKNGSRTEHKNKNESRTDNKSRNGTSCTYNIGMEMAL
jgi:hypothetical protein